MDVPGSEKRETRASTLARAAVLLLLAALSVYVAVRHGQDLRAFFDDPSRVRRWIGSFGVWGPAVSIALSAAQVLIAPIPGQVVGLANGYLWGVGFGLVVSMAGMMLGSVLAMWLARVFGRPLVVRLVDPKDLERWDRITESRGPLFFFLVFLFPFLPDDLACFVIGLSSLPIPRMLVLAGLGRVPGTFVACWLGAHAEQMPPWLLIGSAAFVTLVAVYFARHADKLERRTVHEIEEIEERIEHASTRPPKGHGTDGDGI